MGFNSGFKGLTEWGPRILVSTKSPNMLQFVICQSNNLREGMIASFKVKLKVHLRTSHEGPEGEQRYSSTLFLTLVLVWVVNATPWLLYLQVKDPVHVVQEAGWATGPVWTGAENLAPIRIRSLDHPAHSNLLSWLHYPTLLVSKPLVTHHTQSAHLQLQSST